MLSTRLSGIYLSIFIVSAFLVACGGSETKEVVEGPTEKIVYQLGPDGKPLLGPDGLPLKVVVIETPEQKRERERLEQLELFGPDPYISKTPEVLPLANVKFQVAMTALNSGDEALAEQNFMEMIKDFPTLSGAAYNLALLKVKQGDDKAALTHLETAISRNTYNLNARTLKAIIHRKAGDFANAEKEYLKSIELWGAYMPAYRNLGILYDLYMGKIRKALDYYTIYNSLLKVEDRQILGWSVDIKRQMKTKEYKKRIAEEAKAEAKAFEESLKYNASSEEEIDPSAPVSVDFGADSNYQPEYEPDYGEQE